MTENASMEASASAPKASPAPRNPPTEGGKGERDRREYMKWTPEEEQHFFTVLRACAGQKPEHIISQTCSAIGTKDYKQVRDYYYRMVKRLNMLLGEERKLDVKSQLPVHYSLLKFWEVLRAHGMDGKKLAALKKNSRKRKWLTNTIEKAIQTALRRVKGKDHVSVPTRRVSNVARRRSGPAECVPSSVVATTPLTTPSKGAVAATSAGYAVGMVGRIVCVDPLKVPLSEGVSSRECGGFLPPPPDGTYFQQALITPPQLPAPNDLFAGLVFNSAATTPVTSGSSHIKGPKIQLRLVPLAPSFQKTLEDVCANPFLELTCSANKSFESVVRHLETKWRPALCIGGRMAAIKLSTMPPVGGGCEWSSHAANGIDKVGELYSMMQQPQPFEVYYSWAHRSLDHDHGPASDMSPVCRAPLHQFGLLAQDRLPVEVLPPDLADATKEREADCASHVKSFDELCYGNLFMKPPSVLNDETPPLPDMTDFSLKSWPSLSPPSLPPEILHLSKEVTGFTHIFADLASKGCSPSGMLDAHKRKASLLSDQQRSISLLDARSKQFPGSFDSLLDVRDVLWKGDLDPPNDAAEVRNFAMLFDKTA